MRAVALICFLTTPVFLSAAQMGSLLFLTIDSEPALKLPHLAQIPGGKPIASFQDKAPSGRATLMRAEAAQSANNLLNPGTHNQGVAPNSFSITTDSLENPIDIFPKSADETSSLPIDILLLQP